MQTQGSLSNVTQLVVMSSEGCHATAMPIIASWNGETVDGIKTTLVCVSVCVSANCLKVF